MAKKLTNEEFKERANIKHKGKYIYTETKYVDNKTPVKIICPIHGVFEQTPNSHLQGKGCQKCGHEATNQKNKGTKRSEETKRKLKNQGRKIGSLGYTSESFIEKVRNIYKDKYIFDKIKYRGSTKTVEVICPKHGSFPITPTHLLEGQGCPKCNSSKLEEEIRIFLEENKIDYIEQYNTKEFGRLKIDFFLPKHKIAIECQGEQHFKIVEHFGGKDDYVKRKERDLRKQNICERNGIKLVYFMHIKHNVENVICINDLKELLRLINKINLEI